MRANEIYRSYGTDHKDMTKRLLTKADLVSEIPKKDTLIGIKPNLVTPTPADFGATTHPEVVAGIIEHLQSNGFSNIVILEGSWIGDKTSEAFEYCGYNALSEKYNVPLIDMQKDSSVKKRVGNMDINICKSVADVEFMINVPVLKGHCQTKITCALKNMKGLIPNSEKRRFHTLGLHNPIALLNTAIHQDFIVVDHICGDLSFEEGGNPITTNCVMAAKDPVLVDAFVCRLLGYETKDVPYVASAAEFGVGSADLEALHMITIEGTGSEDIPLHHRPLDVQYAVEDTDSCSACYASLIPALVKLDDENLLKDLKTKICIGQGWQGKTGEIGIGKCTKDFKLSIPGCPPKEEEVYLALKQYITG